MGEILRRTIKSQSVLGKKLEKIVYQKKELVPDKMIIRILSQEIKQVSFKKGLILDGFPRTVEQTEEGERVFQKNKRSIDKVIYIRLLEKESLRRIAKRFNCSSCQKSLILGRDIKKAESACPFCGGSSEKRIDDTPSGARKRIKIFKKETLPVIDYFRRNKILVEVNGKGSIQEIFQRIIKKIK